LLGIIWLFVLAWLDLFGHQNAINVGHVEPVAERWRRVPLLSFFFYFSTFKEKRRFIFFHFFPFSIKCMWNK
jgi:hypothetical protein